MCFFDLVGKLGILFGQSLMKHLVCFLRGIDLLSQIPHLALQVLCHYDPGFQGLNLRSQAFDFDLFWSHRKSL